VIRKVRRSNNKRVVFAIGPWQAVVAAAAIAQYHKNDGYENHLVFYRCGMFAPDPERQKELSEIAGACFEWNSISHCDLPPDLDATNRSSQEAIRNAMQVGKDAHEIWMASLWGQLEKLIIKSFRQPTIIFYEDGLHTYVKMKFLPSNEPASGSLLRYYLRTIRWRLEEYNPRFSVNSHFIVYRQLQRVARAYLVLNEVLGTPNYLLNVTVFPISAEAIRGVVSKGSCEFTKGVILPPSNRPIAIVLCQPFSAYGDITVELERRTYEELCKGLTDIGYQVVWKPHPRAPFVVDPYPGVSVLELALGRLPVEFLYSALNVGIVAGVTSTSLLLATNVFNIRACTCADVIAADLAYPNDQMCELVLKTIPCFSSSLKPMS
jgi:hypothetical protein